MTSLLIEVEAPHDAGREKILKIENGLAKSVRVPASAFRSRAAAEELSCLVEGAT